MAITLRTPADLTDVMLDVFGTLVATTVDRNPGSVIRTIFEAAALLDAEQFVQAAQAVDAFYINTASGDDLARRAAEFNLTRQSPEAATVSAVIADSLVTTPISSTLSAGAAVGASTVTLVDGSTFPASGSVILDRAYGARREKIAFTRSGNTLTLAQNTVYEHALGSTAHLSVQGNDRTFTPGAIKLIVASTAVTPEIAFTSSESVVIYDGDRVSAPFTATCTQTGTVGNVAANRVTAFQVLPFPTALVVSNTTGTGGREIETDASLRDRLKSRILALPASTVSAISAGVLGVVHGSSRVVSASLYENPVTPGDATLYIDDGTSTGIDTTPVSLPASGAGWEVLLPPATTKAGDTRAKLAHAPLTQASDVKLFKSPVNTSVIYKGTGSVIGASVYILDMSSSTPGWTGNAFAPGVGKAWHVVDAMGVPWPIQTNTTTALTLATTATPAPGVWALVNLDATAMENIANWTLNLTTGDIQKNTGSLEDHDVLLVYGTPAYKYLGGLVEEVQKVVNGRADDPTNYPGLKAMGTRVLVTPATIITQAFTIALSVANGYTLAGVTPDVKLAVQNVVNVLPPHTPVLINRVLAAVLAVPGVYNASVTYPTADVAIGQTAVAKTNDASITVL